MTYFKFSIMKNKSFQYCPCRILVWNCTVYYFILRIDPAREFFPYKAIQFLFEVSIGLIISHLIQSIVIKFRILNCTLKQQIVFIALNTFIFSVIYSLANTKFIELLELEDRKWGHYIFWYKVVSTSTLLFFILISWNFVHFLYQRRN